MTETPPRTRRPRRSTSEVRTRILHKGLELFAARGYEPTTQRQIAEAADVSPSVLFRHFDSKSKLLLHSVIEPFGQFVEDISLSLGRTEDGPGRPERFISQLFAHLQPHRASLRAVMSTLTSTDGDQLMRELGLQLDELFAAILSLAVDSRPVVRAEVDIEETDLAVRLAVGTVTTLVVLDDWFLPKLTRRETKVLNQVLARMTVRRLRRSARGRQLPEPSTGTASRPAPKRMDKTGSAEAHSVRAGRRSSDEVRHAILAAAAELFIDKGYAATSYLEIAQAAQTSKSVLYRHFGSKSNLLTEAALDPFAEAFNLMTADWAHVPMEHRRTRQPQFVGDLYRAVVDHRALVRVLMGVSNDPTCRDVTEAVSAWFDDMFSGSLKDLAAQREHERDWYEPKLRMRAVVAMIIAASALDDWFLPHGDAAPQQDNLVTLMSDLVTAGRGDGPAEPPPHR